MNADFSGVVLSGSVLDVSKTPCTDSREYNNTAILTISNADGGTHNVLTWGSDVAGDPTPPIGDFSSLTFVGNDFSNVAQGQVIDLGKLTFVNGASDVSTIVFGGLLDFSIVGQPAIKDAKTGVNIVTTSNDGTDAQNADFVGFSAIPGTTFNVLEGQTASVDVFGYFTGDQQLVLGTLGSSSGGGFTSGTPERLSGKPSANAGRRRDRRIPSSADGSRRTARSAACRA